MEKHHCHNHHQPLKNYSWLKGKKAVIGLVVAGILSLAWLIYKTGTKPSRIGYPCQKAAVVTSMTFLAWIGGIIGGHVLYKRLKPKMTLARVMVVLAMVSFVALGIKEYQLFQVNQIKAQQAGQPIGTPKGVNPGRVVWVHDSNATTGTYSNYWTQVNQATVNNMMDEAVKTLTSQTSVGAALSRIFPCGASCTGRKVAIKVNMNNDTQGQAKMDANYQPVKAFLKEITTAVPGVFSPFNQADIYIYDASRWMGITERLYFVTEIKKDYPNVHLVGMNGASGGETAIWSSESFIYESNFCSPTYSQNLKVPQLVKDADYLVNMPLLKGHGMSGGSTLGFKNFLGNVANIMGYGPAWNTDGLHGCLVVGNNPKGLVAVYTAGFHNNDGSLSSIDRKMVLTIGDALYGNAYTNIDPPLNWRMFGNKTPNSLFVSQDPVAVDSVMFDTIMQEAQNYQIVGQEHLEAAAQRLAGSLGVHEHPNMTGKCSSADNLNCWQFGGIAAQGIDFVNCDAQATPDSRCVLGVSTSGGAIFSLQSSKASYTTAEEIPVQVLMNSETDAANVFSAQINFPAQSLTVDRIDITGSFVSFWTDNFFDNTAGKISLIGTVPNPGYQTSLGQNVVMATVIFKSKLAGSAAISFDLSSQILRNSDSTNILTITNNSSVTVASAPTPTPTPTTVPCNLASATWSTLTATQGNRVNLNVSANSSCTNQAVTFTVIRNGASTTGGNDVSIQPNPQVVNIASGSASTSWTAEFNPLLPFTNPQYYFTASVVGGNTVDTTTNLLTVTQAQGGGTPTPTPVPTASTDWPQVQKDPQHTGYSNETLGTNFKVVWTHPFQPDKVYPAVQAIVYRGKVFVGTEGANGQKPTMYALNATSSGGQVAWKYDAIDGPILNSVAADNGKIYFGSLEGWIYALYTDTENDHNAGELAWKQQLSTVGFSTAPVVADNKVMIGGRNGTMYGLDPNNGTTLWSYQASGPIMMTAAWDNGRVIFTSNDMYVYALNSSDGSLFWKSAHIAARAFKDYWPVVTQGKVIVRALGQGLVPVGDFTDTTQDATLARYDANPNSYDKTLFILDENSGQESPALIQWDVDAMDGPPAPPCIDRDGYLVQPLVRAGSWEAGWGRYDINTRKVVQPLDDSAGLIQSNGSPVGYGNSDETFVNSCSQNLILVFHGDEKLPIHAGYMGFYNLANNSWTEVLGGMRNMQMSTITQGGGGNAPSISNGIIYHVADHELVVRTTN